MGWGSSTRRGGGQKVRARPRKFVFLGFRREESGMCREFAGMSRTPGVFKKFVLKKFVRIFRSLLSRRALTCEGGIPGRFPTGKGKPLYLPKSP